MVMLVERSHDFYIVNLWCGSRMASRFS